jgi:Fe-S cluster assembly protein SufD
MKDIALLNIDRLRAFSHEHNEPSWMLEARLAGAKLAAEIDWPKVDKVRLEGWPLAAAVPSEPTCDEFMQVKVNMPSELITELGGITVQIGGFMSSLLSPELKAAGVIFTDLRTAAREYESLVQKHLYSLIQADEDKSTALHAALWDKGIFLYIPRGVEVTLPLQGNFLPADKENAFGRHVLIVAEENSSVTYVDVVETSDNLGKRDVEETEVTAAGDITGVAAEGIGNAGAGSRRVHSEAPLLHLGEVEIVAGAGAKVRYVAVHNMEARVIDMTKRRADIARDGAVEWIICDLQDGNVVADTHSDLRGDGSRTDTKLISVAGGKQEMGLTTSANHYGRSSDSMMVSRVAMTGSAKAIINGITKIEHGATKANGQQAEKVLMLSPKARGDANPILLIDENDVMAGHAASVGQVNPDQVYYLMSRGISRQEAERLIIHGFLSPVVAEIPLEHVREMVEQLLTKKLMR